jgi:RNA polymerase sigma factor (sigma-70 family)
MNMTPQQFKTIDKKVRNTARAYCARAKGKGRGLSFEDTVSDGWVGALKAFPRFDERRGYKLESFLGPRILGAILDSARRQDPLSRLHRKAIKEDKLPGVFTFSTDGIEKTLPLPDPGACRNVEQAEARLQFEQMLKQTTLSAREEKFVERRWVEGMSFKQIARELEVNESRASQIAREIVEKIRAANSPGSNAFSC